MPHHRDIKRSEHVWFRLVRKGLFAGYKCCVCGALTRREPPDRPTPEDWMPERYEELTPDERAMSPFRGGVY
jgi:hypothetical protein